MFFDRGTFWVFPLAYFDLPKSARASFFPNLSKLITFAAAPLVLTPFVRNQGNPSPANQNAHSCFCAQDLGITRHLADCGFWDPIAAATLCSRSGMPMTSLEGTKGVPRKGGSQVATGIAPLKTLTTRVRATRI